MISEEQEGHMIQRKANKLLQVFGFFPIVFLKFLSVITSNL